jgi:hypothetical protein
VLDEVRKLGNDRLGINRDKFDHGLELELLLVVVTAGGKTAWVTWPGVTTAGVLSPPPKRRKRLN